MQTDRLSPPATSPLILSNHGEVRTGSICSLPRVITTLGGNPQHVFEAAGVDLEQFVINREQRLDVGATSQLFSFAMQDTRCAHLGILLGQRFNIKDLGPVGELMLLASTAQEALQDLVAQSRLHDRGASPLLLPLSDHLSLLGYVINRHDLPDPRPVLDTAVMIGYQILREFLGPHWTPVRVQLAYRTPADTATYMRAFRCPVQFNANVSGLVIINHQLNQKLSTASPEAHRLLQEAIASTTASLTTSEQIRYQLHSLLLLGEAKAEQIASRVDLHIRTLHRRLSAEGTHVQKLITESRRSLAIQLLTETDLPISAIAESLQYQDPNAFSRAFKTWTGCSPQHWRNASCCH
ncbi:AraC family transcriptional regulator [Pseudomonas resinovorans]|uniref:AraC family transcriptional regulator n=1 Tax=Metapseudomonas resinovorans TaxID=53412 RepID=A0ABT4YDC7_METRE|nr:AraC family transcriptional regulator [Pseudomonas resinovorans]MDA8486726.1 AraC family transcriptional regulator [Pseudomonas resinovorans]